MATVISVTPRFKPVMPHLAKAAAMMNGCEQGWHGQEKAAGVFHLFLQGYDAKRLEIAMLDQLDRQIVELLAGDGRMSLKVLAQRISLSPPSTSERLRRLEERGVIRSTVEVDLRAAGYTLQAIVRMRPLPGKLKALQALIEATPEFSDCDKVTGDDCFIGRLHLRSIEQLDQILDRITDKAETSTSIVKAQPVARRLPPL